MQSQNFIVSTLGSLAKKPKSIKQQVELYTYKYLNGILKDSTVDYTEDEIVKQLKNYWRESI